MLNFDHPLTERVRSLIRIEHLFNRFNHATSGDDKWSHHIALSTLFEIMESSSRAELKLDICRNWNASGKVKNIKMMCRCWSV